MEYFLSIITAYLLGSLNFGIIVSKLLYKQDIRGFGSGSAGMTNMLRTYGVKAAVVVLLGDLLKGIIAVLLARYLFSNPENANSCSYIAGFFAILGHLFPVFFKFKGGKGMVTTAGVLLVLNPVVLIVLLIPFLIIAFSTRYVSVASITVAFFFPIVTFFWLNFQDLPFVKETIFAALIGALLIYMHRENIKRLIKGEENRFGKKK